MKKTAKNVFSGECTTSDDRHLFYICSNRNPTLLYAMGTKYSQSFENAEYDKLLLSFVFEHKKEIYVG